jgi:outer membrane protein OmpA-like peptidoglycan-associated protein
MPTSRTPSTSGGTRRLLAGLAGGSVIAATLTAMTASGAVAASSGPVVLDGFRAVCWSAEDTMMGMPGMGHPGPMVEYTKKLVSAVHRNADADNDGTVAVLGVAATTQTCRFQQSYGTVTTQLLGSTAAEITYYPTAADVEGFLADLSEGDVDPAFVWLPDGAVDVGAALAANAGALRDYVSAGGGLLAHQNSYSWLDEFAPGVTMSPKPITGNGDENVTAAGAEVFELLETDVPFGSEQAFGGDLGALVPYIQHVSGVYSTVGTVRVAPVLTAPAAPTLSSPVALVGAVELTLGAPASDGGAPVTGYTVNASPGDRTEAVSQPGTVRLDGLTPGVDYTFTATATNAVGTSPASTPVGGVALPPVVPVPPPAVAVAPGAPSLSKVVAGNGRLTATVGKPTADGGAPVTSYVVVAQPGGRRATVDRAGSVTVKGLTNGTAYALTARATSSVGTSVASAAVSGTPRTVPARPAAPKVAGRTLDSLTLRVTAPENDGGAPVQRLEVSVKGSGAARTYPVGAEGGRLRVAGLRPRTAYRVTVVAVNRAGSSAAATASVSTKPVPKKPQPISAVKGTLHPGMTATLTGDGLFRYGSAKLTGAGRAQVSTLATTLTTAKRIRCEGHTDGAPSRANHALGLARAKAVCSTLRAHGVKAKATAVSFGAKRKVRTGGSAASRAVNRRVEVSVLR